MLAIPTVFQLDYGGDLIYEMRRGKHEPTFLLTQGIVKLRHHIGMIIEELAFHEAVGYTQRGHGL